MMQLSGSLLLAALGASSARADECVSQKVLMCINDKYNGWPPCDSAQEKKDQDSPQGYEFGFYCSQEWVNSLNEMLSEKEVGICGDKGKIAEVLAETAFETGYFTTVFQPADGGAGLIHMIPANWPGNAKHMDEVFPGHGYAAKEASEKQKFFQSPENGWLSVAAWYKGGSVVAGCEGKDLFKESFDEQTRCIKGFPDADRNKALEIAKGCMDAPDDDVPIDPSESTTSAPEDPTTIGPEDPTTPEPTIAPEDPTTQEPTIAPEDPTTQEPTIAPEDPTTQEPTIAPEDPTTQEPTVVPTVGPVDPTTPEPTSAPEDPTTVPEDPTTQQPTTVPPVDPTTQEPTIAPVDPTTTTTVAPVDPTTQEPTSAPEEPTTTRPLVPTPSPERCHTCLTMCAPCQACTEGPDGSFAFGSCKKCWQCWDWDDDELEDDDDDMDEDCDAMHKDHDWDDEEVRCLTDDHEDCTACWAAGLLGEVPVFV